MQGQNVLAICMIVWVCMPSNYSRESTQQYIDTGAIWKVHTNLFLVRKAFTWALLKMQHKIWLIRIERHAKDHQSLLFLAHKRFHVPKRTNSAETFHQAFLIYEVKRGGTEHALCEFKNGATTASNPKHINQNSKDLSLSFPKKCLCGPCKNTL